MTNQKKQTSEAAVRETKPMCSLGLEARRSRFSISFLQQTGVEFGVNAQNEINPAKPST